MIYPSLSNLRIRDDAVETFRGYHRTDRPGVGEFTDMKNLSSDGAPLLSSRPGREEVARVAAPGGILWKDVLVRVDGDTLYMGDYPALTGLTDGPKSLISMGATILVFPDRVYLNTLDFSDYGPIEAEKTLQTAAVFTPATAEGVALPAAQRRASPPENPVGGDYWVDTSGATPVWKVYAGDAGVWTDLPATWIRLSAPGVAQNFAPGDGVTLTGIDPNLGDLAALEGTTVVVTERYTDLEGEGAGDWILFAGVLPGEVVQEGSGLTLARRLPDMDFYLEAGNRLWGCRYGLDAAGRPVNEIYASKLGDFRNFHVFQGLSTDSYAMSLGSDGPFTGAVSYLGMPTFFKEGVIHTVWGSLPENFRLQTLSAPGVARGSAGSLCTVGGLLYYLSPVGVMRYDGSLPEAVGKALGEEPYHDGVGGDGGERYYLSVLDRGEGPNLLVYDTVRNMWHREDDLRVTAFAAGEGNLYAQTPEGAVWKLRGTTAPGEVFDWMAQTGPICPDHPDRERMLLLSVRLRLESGGYARFLVRYDGEGEFQEVGRVESRNLRVRTFHIRPKACDYLELRMEGQGALRLYNMTRRMEVAKS